MSTAGKTPPQPGSHKPQPSPPPASPSPGGAAQPPAAPPPSPPIDWKIDVGQRQQAPTSPPEPDVVGDA